MKPVRLALLFTLGLALSGQQPEGGVKISVNTNLVIVNVGVKDKDGKPIEGLKAGDFTIQEDGRPQKISVFEYQRLETDPLPPAPPAPKEAEPEEPRVGPAQITPSRPGQVRYRDRRLLVLFFDFSSMPQEDQLRAQTAALKFIDTQMTESDLVSIMAFTSSLHVIEDFTQDRDRLRAAIEGFRIGEASELAVDGSTGSDDDPDTGAAFTPDETEFNIFNTDRKLGALEDAAKMLTSLPEKKAFVYFSSGISQTGSDNQSQLRSTINAAVRSNVSFFPIDARGLVATAPAGNANQASGRGTGVFSGSAQRGQASRFAGQQETLATLASDTGGKVMLDNNDLGEGIVQAQKEVSSYYILGYYTTNPAEDGRYRRVRVTIGSNKQAKLDYRSGYFAPKEFKNFNSTDKERQLEEALALGDPITDLPIALEVNWFRMERDRYFVPLAVKIPGSEINMALAGKADEAVFDFIGQVRNERGMLMGTVRDNIKVKLQGESAGLLKSRMIQYDSGFTLLPGRYSLKFLARENESGKIGTFETEFTIPDLATETNRLRTSSVVFANQREQLSAAIGAAEKDKKAIQMHPLIRDNQKLIPSITRVYRKDQNMYVYVEVYDPGRTGPAAPPDVMASLSFFRGKTKAFETQPVKVDYLLDKRGQNVLPVQIQVPLDKLQPGSYTCQLNVVDEVGKKFSFARAPVVLLAR